MEAVKLSVYNLTVKSNGVAVLKRISTNLTDQWDNWRNNIQEETMKKVIIILLMVALVATLFTGCATKVEGKVISCEEGRVVKNNSARVMANYSFATGKTTQAIMHNNLANIETQMYNVVVEYEGVQYTIETKKAYEVGSAILFYLPKE